MFRATAAWRSQSSIFFLHDTATTELYTLSLHDALPIYRCGGGVRIRGPRRPRMGADGALVELHLRGRRSEEHTSELQSRRDLVCRLLLEKKKLATEGKRGARYR